MHAFASRKNLNVALDISRSPIRPSFSFHQLLFFLIPSFQLCLVRYVVLGPLIPAAICQLNTVKDQIKGKKITFKNIISETSLLWNISHKLAHPSQNRQDYRMMHKSQNSLG
jgi:hypothetical protein